MAPQLLRRLHPPGAAELKLNKNCFASARLAIYWGKFQHNLNFRQVTFSEPLFHLFFFFFESYVLRVEDFGLIISFSTLKMSVHNLLVCIVSEDKSALILAFAWYLWRILIRR